MGNEFDHFLNILCMVMILKLFSLPKRHGVGRFSQLDFKILTLNDKFLLLLLFSRLFLLHVDYNRET